MILAIIVWAATPFVLVSTDAHGQQRSVRYASEAQCERARVAAVRELERRRRAGARRARRNAGTVWVIDPSCLPR